MAKKVYNYANYIVLDTGKELIIKNSKGNHDNHAHFRKRTNKQGKISLNTVKTCIRLCDAKRLDIRSDYMLEAIKRIALDKDYISDLERKQAKETKKYINVQKGVRP